jgi:hypothetical protein
MIVVPNPKKEVRIKFPIDKVKEVIKSLPEYAKTTTLAVSNDTMNYYQFTAKGEGFFSLGLILEVSVFEITSEITEIRFEGRRAIGWIDNTSEITATYNYINGCISLTGKVLTGVAKKAS